MHTNIRHLHNITPFAIVVERAEHTNVPIESVILDCVLLAMTNETCDRVQLLDGDKKYWINGSDIINQIRTNVQPK